MANIDTLDIQFNSKGTDDAVNNIKSIASAVSSLADNLKALNNGSNLNAFKAGMSAIKSTIPTAEEVLRMGAFADAVTRLSNIIGVENIAPFGQAMAEVGRQAQRAAEDVGQATERMANRFANAPADIFNFEATVPTLDRVASRVDKIKTLFKGVAVPTKPFKNLEEKADKVARKYDELREKMIMALANGDVDIRSTAFHEMEAELDALRNKYNDLILKQKELTLEGGAIKFNPTAKAALDAFAQGFTKVTDIAKGVFSSAMKKASGLVKSFASHVKSAAKSAKSLVTGGNSATDMAKKFAKELVRVTKMLKLMITRTALRQVIKEIGNGFKSLALHSEQFDKTMSDVINASKRLGYSFSAMVAPLINALAPAILYIIDLLTRLINVINQVISALTGATTWNKAVKFTDKWSDSIKEAGKSGSKAAKELKKTVLGFDELNQLQDNKNSGGGGSDIKDMFETVPIDPKWRQFADWIKEMWKLGDFTELGKLWGTKLRDLLESIPWDDIQDTAGRLGKSLATLINGFVEVERLGYDIGKTIAQSLNTVFRFVNDFVHAIHWDSIGKFIAETFNGFFENIHWGVIKDTVVSGLAGLADAINSFIREFHWDNISKTIVNGLNIIIKGVNTFFRRVQWGKLGKELGDQLQKTIEGIHWRELGETLGRILQSVIDFVSNFIHQLKVDEIRAKLKEMVDGFFDTVNVEELGQTLADIIDLVIQIAAGFWKDNGSRIKEEGKKLIKSIWDNIDAQTKEDLAKIVGQIITVAVLAGLGKALVSIAASAIVKGFSTKLCALLFGSEVAGIGGGAVAKGAEAVGTAASTSFASSFLAGISAALIPVAVTAALGYGIAIPASKKLEEILAGTQQKVDDIKTHMDDTIPTYDEMSRAAREASRNQKEYAEKMQDMYDTLLKTHPELANLKEALEDNGIKIGNNVERLLEINEGLTIFNSNGGSAADTLSTLEEKYGKVDKKTQDFFYSLGECNGKYDDVIDKVNTYNAKIEENDKATGNLIKTYQSEKEYLEDRQKAVDNVVGSFKTHWDVVNQNKDATEKLTGTYKTHEDVMREYNKKLGDVTTATEKVLGGEQDIVGYTPTFEGSMADMQKAMDDTGTKAKDTGEQIVEGIKEPMRTANFSEETKSLFDIVFKGLSLAFGIASPAKNMMPIGENIVLGVNEGMQEEYKSFDATISDFYENHVKTWFDKDKWSFDGVAEGLKKTFEGAKTAIKDVWNGIADKVNGEHEIGSSKIKINLPKVYARGGFPEDGLFFANHNELVGSFSNGKTAVANNEQIVAGIERGVYSAVSAAMANNSGGSSYISNEIVVDGDVFARTVTKALEKENRRYSPQTS